MPEVPNAYQCDYCRKIMVPLEQETDRWHTKWCSLCHMPLYDVLIGGDHPVVDVNG
jgi:hypothetical protein